MLGKHVVLRWGLVALFVLSGCATAPTRETPSTTPVEEAEQTFPEMIPEPQEEVTETVHIGYGMFPVERGQSIQHMLSFYPSVVIGRVISHTSPAIPAGTNTDPHAGESPGAANSQKPLPAPSADQPDTSTLFTVQIRKVIQGDFKAGQTVLVGQNGSFHKGVAYEVEHDRLMKNGETFLLFLRPMPNGEFYTAPAFGRFRISGDNRVKHIDDFFAAVPVVKELTGAEVTAAESKIKAKLK